MHKIILFFIATLYFFALDMLWLGFLARNFYRQRLSFMLSDTTNWYAAAAFYVIYISGLLHFVVLPAIKTGQWQSALLNGAILGIVCYATYDLVNMATISRWPLVITVVDIIWGAFITGSCALAAYFVGTKWLHQ